MQPPSQCWCGPGSLLCQQQTDRQIMPGHKHYQITAQRRQPKCCTRAKQPACKQETGAEGQTAQTVPAGPETPIPGSALSVAALVTSSKCVTRPCVLVSTGGCSVSAQHMWLQSGAVSASICAQYQELCIQRRATQCTPTLDKSRCDRWTVPNRPPAAAPTVQTGWWRRHTRIQQAPCEIY
jgi:hypothetical protein